MNNGIKHLKFSWLRHSYFGSVHEDGSMYLWDCKK
jgi:hypothetical protein